MVHMQNLLDYLSSENFDARLSRRNLSYFYTAAKFGNFTVAAKKCGVAQPSLSRGIKLLEDAIDTPLFERVGRNVIITAKAEELLPKVELYLNQCIDFTTFLSARGAGAPAELKIASISSLTAYLLPSLINQFEAENEKIKITLLDGINPEIVAAVDVGDVDLGIISTQEDPKRFWSRELFRDQYCLVVNQDHRFHARETVRWEELKQEELAVFKEGSNSYEIINDVFRAIGMFFEPAVHVRFRNTLMGLVKHRGLAAILPKLVVQETEESGIRVIPLVDPVVHRTYYLVERKDRFKKDETDFLEAFLRVELRAFEKLARENEVPPRNG
ncbi:LysR family transcriptional regulator [Sulfitobacter sp.]|uniref:LysR family transcriptional regulator n=1 Tax=Sulfitobacter sp. TaxID=1903071 RepID=UPI0030014E92